MITTVLCYSATSGSVVTVYDTPCRVDMGNVGSLLYTYKLHYRRQSNTQYSLAPANTRSSQCRRTPMKDRLDAETAHLLQQKNLRLPRRVRGAPQAVPGVVRPVMVGDCPTHRNVPLHGMALEGRQGAVPTRSTWWPCSIWPKTWASPTCSSSKEAARSSVPRRPARRPVPAPASSAHSNIERAAVLGLYRRLGHDLGPGEQPPTATPIHRR